MLAHPRPEANLRLSTDASSTAIGAVLEQQNNKFWQPLGFFSKKLSAAQRKYSTYDRELLAAYLSAKHFLHLIEGRMTILYTDHKPLVYVFHNKVDKYNDRQTRHISFLAQYVHHIEHVQGDRNIIPDALSRLETVGRPEVLPDIGQLATDQANDPELRSLIDGTVSTSLQLQPLQTPDGTVYCDKSTGNFRTYVPNNLRRPVFLAIHSQAHPGATATVKVIKSRYCWPGMDRQIRTWTRCCESCQRSKTHRHTISPITPFALPDRRFGHIHVDIVGPLPPSDNQKYLLTCVDRFIRDGPRLGRFRIFRPTLSPRFW